MKLDRKTVLVGTIWISVEVNSPSVLDGATEAMSLEVPSKSEDAVLYGESSYELLWAPKAAEDNSKGLSVEEGIALIN